MKPLQCQAFDVIGSVGFGKIFNAATDLASEGAQSCHAVEQGGSHLMGVGYASTDCVLYRSSGGLSISWSTACTILFCLPVRKWLHHNTHANRVHRPCTKIKIAGHSAEDINARHAAAQSVVNNLRNPVSWIPFTKPWREHRANIRRVLGVMRNLLQEVHDRCAPPPAHRQLGSSKLVRFHEGTRSHLALSFLIA